MRAAVAASFNTVLVQQAAARRCLVARPASGGYTGRVGNKTFPSWPAIKRKEWPMAPETSVQAPESAPKKASRWEDFVDIFMSPSQLFRRRADDSWTMPILVVCLL